MRSHIKLGHVFGVELGLHYSWLIIAALITFSLAAHFQSSNPDWGRALAWIIAVVTAVLFFAGLFAHELSHALVARSRNIPVHRITLFALGGMAQMEKESTDAQTEFWIGIAGPITSVVIAFILLGVARAAGWTRHSDPETPVLAVLVWLGYINLALGLFNMVPGYPLDGGRVLRAILWWTSGSAERATRIASRIGQIVGVAMILWGLFQFFRGAGFGGLWLAFIGWFLLEAARASYLQFEASSALKDLRAQDLMSRECASLEGETSVQQFVDEQLLRSAQRCFAVTEAGRICGIITPEEVRSLDRARWPATPLREIMRPLNKVRSVSPETPVVKAMELMARDNVSQLPVISNQHLEGILTRNSILQVLQSRAELRAG